MNLSAALPKIEEYRKLGKQITLVTGVFDLLHQEHQKFLLKAKKLADILIVGIESDIRVAQIKGPGRPINPESKRLEAVKKLNIADIIFILPEKFSNKEDHIALIAQIKPRYLAVSSHTKHLDKKQQILQLFGGDVKIVHQHNPAISTTLLLTQKPNETIEN